MRRNYFIINGEKYYTGTVFIIMDLGQQKEASFICYDEERKKYLYKIKQCTWFTDDETFQKRFVRLTNKIDINVHMPVTKRLPNSRINGLPLGWLWYIFLMGISVIFKDVIGLWILISVVFFSWRTEKIKKEGTYIEW